MKTFAIILTLLFFAACTTPPKEKPAPTPVAEKPVQAAPEKPTPTVKKPKQVQKKPTPKKPTPNHAHSQGSHKKAHDHKATAKKVGDDKILVKVKGMVCAFCAQGIEKNFNKREEVKSTQVDLDKMEVTVVLHKGKDLSQKVIKEVVTGAGFSFEGVKK